MLRDREFLAHLHAFFAGRAIETERLSKGRIVREVPGFEVLVVTPSAPSDAWCYVSNGARDISIHGDRQEYCLLAQSDDEAHREILAMVASYHASARYGGVHLGRVLDIGQPWTRGATCDHLLVSLPYPFGPRFEHVPSEPPVRVLWLLPITKREAELARDDGVEALEQLFERLAIDTLDPRRRSAV